VNLSCPFCKHSFTLTAAQTEIPKFCPYCGNSLKPTKAFFSETSELTQPGLESVHTESPISFIQGHVPQEDQIRFSIGHYQIIESIGKGGMGEVFLAYDTSCGRRIALKRIREDLLEHKQIQNRFLKEAYITSQLTHPAIIPIYSIHVEPNLVYYTMPFVEGQTLKQVLKDTRKLDKLGIKADQTGSIPFLMRIFLSICQAVAYAHSKNILHRDLKLENIIVGKYGEVLILDWGLAQLIKSNFVEEDELPEPTLLTQNPLHHITRLGKVVGTIAYMAPERAMGLPANFQTDIYSLGVILYQMLTLRHPFKRGTLKEFRKTMSEEKLHDPTDVAPYRDIPRILSQIALKCISTSLDQRYKKVEDLVRDLETFLEGRSEWIQITTLDLVNKSDWEFQENVLIAEHTAITRETEISDWVGLMISKASFTENTRIETTIKLGENCQGIGFLLSVPETDEREHLNDGYCLWLGSDSHRSTKLLRSTVEVMHHPDIFLHRQEAYIVRIERIDQNIYFYLNNTLQFSYISHLPLSGTHIGLMTRDADFEITPLSISVGSLNIKVNCLAVPDAFLAHKDYATAVSEYRRIGYSFPGTAEGREAMFRAGITLLEEARDSIYPEKKQELYELALDEFYKLHSTPGAPLEYLGKALVYQSLEDFDEEIKCFELAYRRYPKHPLLPVLEEHILYRMLESSRQNRKATYQFALFAARHLPNIYTQTNVKKLFHHLQRHWEFLPFILKDKDPVINEKYKQMEFSTLLAFWVAKPYTLSEIVDDLIKEEIIPMTHLCNALYCLVELGSYAMAKSKIKEHLKHIPTDTPDFPREIELINSIIQVHSTPIQKVIDEFIKTVKGPILTKSELRAFLYMIHFALKKRNFQFVIQTLTSPKSFEYDSEGSVFINSALICAYLGEGNFSAAGVILQGYPMEVLHHDLHPLHLFYGIWLHMTESKEIAQIHFSGMLEVPFPRTWTLFSHMISHQIHENTGWLEKAFMWEKRRMYCQAAFYYYVLGDIDKADHYANLEAQQYVFAKV
jgi:serine/threonine-protein kinase